MSETVFHPGDRVTQGTRAGVVTATRTEAFRRGGLQQVLDVSMSNGEVLTMRAAHFTHAGRSR